MWITQTCHQIHELEYIYIFLIPGVEFIYSTNVHWVLSLHEDKAEGLRDEQWSRGPAL